MKTLTLCFFLCTLLTACAAETDPVLDAQRDAAATQVAILGGTATANVAELRTTLEFAVTRASLAATRGAFLELTLVARGTPQAVLDAFQSQVMASLATATPAPAIDAAPTPAGAAPQPLPIVVTPLALPTSNAPTPDPTQPQLVDIVTAPSVGADDCAVGVTSEFTTASAAIYVVARARNIAPGTRLSSQWNANGQPVVAYDFTPDFAIADACIWFFITPQDVAFAPGNWSVQLAINGAASGAPATFAVRDASGG